MGSTVVLLTFILVVSCFAQSIFAQLSCSFCYNDSANYINNGLTWKQPPNQWQQQLPSFAWHKMAIAYESYSSGSKTYGVISGGGFNASLPPPKNNDIQYYTTTTALLEMSLETGALTVTNLTTPIFPYLGHTLTGFPACSGCHPAGAAVIDGKSGVVIIGGVRQVIGTNATYASDIVYISVDPVSKAVTYYNITAPSSFSRYFHSAVHTKYIHQNIGINGSNPRYNTAGSIVIYSGIGSTGSTEIYYNEVLAFHFLTQTVEVLHNGQQPAPLARKNHAAATFGSKMVIFGGQLSTSDVNGTNEMWSFDYVTRKWTLITLSPQPQDGPTSVYSHVAFFTSIGSLVVFGGRTSDSVYSDIYEFNFNSLAWDKHCATPVSTSADRGRTALARFSFGAFYLNDSMFIYGGELPNYVTGNGTVFTNSLYFYDLNQVRTLGRCEGSCQNISYCSEVTYPAPTCNSAATPFPCIVNGTWACLTSPNLCTPARTAACLPTNPYKCWNGRCVPSSISCPPIPRCPNGYKRCSDGSCIPAANNCPGAASCGVFCNSTGFDLDCLPACCPLPCPSNATAGSAAWKTACCLNETTGTCCPYANSSCCTSSPTNCSVDTIDIPKPRCDDGSCQINVDNDCFGVDGCSIVGSSTGASGVTCPDGTCATNIANCATNCPSSYRCSDGTCSTINGCNVPPFWNKMSSQKVITNIGGNFLFCLSPKNETIAYIRYRSFVNPNLYQRVYPAESDFQKYVYTNWNTKKAGIPNTDSMNYNDNIWSPVLTLTLINAGSYVASLNAQLLLYFGLPQSRVSDAVNYGCVAYLSYVGNSPRWTCVKDTLSISTLNVTNPPFPAVPNGFVQITSYLGVLLNASYFYDSSDANLPFTGTFAIIRRNWPLPTIPQILQDISTNMATSAVLGLFSAPADASSPPLLVTITAVSVANATVTFTSDGLPAALQIRSSIFSRYGFPAENISVTTTQSKKRQNNYLTIVGLNNEIVSPPINTPTPTIIVTPTPTPSSPTTTGSTTGSNPVTPPPDSSSSEFYIGIGVGVGVVLICIIVIVILCCKRSKKKGGGGKPGPSTQSRAPMSDYSRANQSRAYDSRAAASRGVNYGGGYNSSAINNTNNHNVNNFSSYNVGGQASNPLLTNTTPSTANINAGPSLGGGYLVLDSPNGNTETNTNNNNAPISTLPPPPPALNPSLINPNDNTDNNNNNSNNNSSDNNNVGNSNNNDNPGGAVNTGYVLTMDMVNGAQFDE